MPGFEIFAITDLNTSRGVSLILTASINPSVRGAIVAASLTGLSGGVSMITTSYSSENSFKTSAKRELSRSSAGFGGIMPAVTTSSPS